MNLTLAVMFLLSLPPPLAHGTATHYAPGLMTTVVRNRTRWHQIHPARGELDYIALADCALLDHLVWLQHPTGTVGPLLVADCAANRHKLPAHWAADLSFTLAQRLNTVNHPLTNVTIWQMQPGEKHPVAYPTPRTPTSISSKGSDTHTHTHITRPES